MEIFTTYRSTINLVWYIIGMITNIRGDFLKLIKKLGVITLSTGLSIGILTPYVSATSLENEQPNNVQIQVSQVESVITKGELIKKFKEFFPNQFSFLNESDFDMWSGRYPDDDTIRYDLNFHKFENGKQIYGGVSFVGENLEIESFHYQPANAVDALFPAKVTKEQAKEAALAFLKKFPQSSDYKLQTDLYEFYPSNQLLTEPYRYSFSFVRMKNNVPISDQQIQVTVLGNGEVSDFYRYSNNYGTKTYDDVTKVLPKNEILSKVKENFALDLQYSIDTDYRTGKTEAQLVYQPTSYRVHALTGDWVTMNGLSSELPKGFEISPIVPQGLQPKQTNISLEEAKALANKLLAIDSKDITLRIDSIDEQKNHNGQEVISINYMYEYRNGGTGTNLVIDKRTGEIIQYHDIKSEVLRENNEGEKATQAISKEEALNQAVKYLKEFAPSYLHNYAMPIGDYSFDEERGYYFFFPRVVNGLIVNGDQISVSISNDGTLLGLTVNQVDIKSWPSVEKVISEEQATEKFLENLDLDLNYVIDESSKNKDHYNLVYSPVFNESVWSSFDAITGEWTSLTKNKPEVISPKWSEKELNHMIQAGIINVGDAKTFDGNAKVTKGTALEVLMRSMSHIYVGSYGERNKSQSFENIKPDHPLYQVVELAVSQGILEKAGNNFNLDEGLTREELAVWYIRTLGLEEAAKSQGIYQLNFADAKDVKPENIGYVALAQSLGLITTNNNKFNPKQEVTYADLAVSTVRLAHEVYKKGIQIYY